MRVVTQNTEEFLESLEDVKSVFDGIIRVSISKRPTTGNPKTAVVFEVVLQASTMAQSDTGDYYLLEFGEICGSDRNDVSQDKSGTQRAERLKEQIKEFSAKKGWRILPGILSE